MIIITHFFNISLDWGINNIIFLLNAWFPSNVLVNVSQLTPHNLDLVLLIVKLVNAIVNYLQPVLHQIDPATLTRVLNGLLELCHHLSIFWLKSQQVLDNGQLDIGHYEAVEVYHDIVRNAIIALRGLIISMQAVLNV